MTMLGAAYAPAQDVTSMVIGSSVWLGWFLFWIKGLALSIASFAAFCVWYAWFLDN